MCARIALALLLVSLSSCAPKQEIAVVPLPVIEDKQESADQEKSCLLDARRVSAELEARWNDAPLPFDAQLDQAGARESIDGLSGVFSFSTSMVPDACYEFYHEHMERLGWQDAALFSFMPHEMILIYEKPAKRAVIMLESIETGIARLNSQMSAARMSPRMSPRTSVRLYIGIKKGGHV